MRLGMFMMPLHPAGRPMHAYLAEDTEKALLLEKLGSLLQLLLQRELMINLLPLMK